VHLRASVVENSSFAGHERLCGGAEPPFSSIAVRAQPAGWLRVKSASPASPRNPAGGFAGKATDADRHLQKIPSARRDDIPATLNRLNHLRRGESIPPKIRTRLGISGHQLLSFRPTQRL
jgi:hypothetical protein